MDFLSCFFCDLDFDFGSYYLILFLFFIFELVFEFC